MAKQDTFKVSSKSHPEGVVVTNERVPETLEEFETLGLVKEYPQGVITLAYQNWVIKAQGGARQRLPDPDAVQEFVDNYTFGERISIGVAKKPTLKAEAVREFKFTKAQLEALAAAGMNIEDLG